jgi:hypothetical protein
MIRAALLHLGFGSALGSALLFNSARLHEPALRSLPSLHVEMLLLGWMVQLALGVGYWILPRTVAGEGRGSGWLGWLGMGALNLGVLVAGVSGTLAVPGAFLEAGRLVELIGAICFATLLWPRIRSFAR